MFSTGDAGMTTADASAGSYTDIETMIGDAEIAITTAGGAGAIAIGITTKLRKRLALLPGFALGSITAISPAYAQMQQKGGAEEKSAPQATEKSKGKDSAEPKGKGSGRAEPSTGKGSAQTESKGSTKGSAETQSKEQGTKGSAQTQPKEQDKSSASKSEKSGDRVQLSEQQRTSVHQTVLKEKNVNRVNQVNFSISVGTRVPRSVHLR